MIRVLIIFYCSSSVPFLDYETSSFVGGVGYGIFYIAGLSYIHFRTTNHKHRVARIALCHLSMAIGIVSAVHQMSQVWSWWSTQFIFGYFLTYSSGSVLILFLAHELMHGLGVYNYKRALDPHMHAADQAKDLFKTALNPPQGIVVTTRNKARQTLLTLLMMFAKSLNGFYFNNIFLFIALVTQSALMRNGVFMLHYFSLTGVIVGIILSLSTKVKVQYPVILLGQIIVLAVAGILWETSSFEAAAVFFWLFYLIAGAAIFIPDVAIMEVGNPIHTEFSLCVGFILEQIPILISVYYVTEQWTMVITESKMFWINAGVYMFCSACVAVAVMMFYPNTFKRSALEIQHLILYNFAGPFPTPATTTHQPLVHHPPQHVTMIPAGLAVQYPPPQGGFVMAVPPPAQLPAGSQAYYSTQPAYPGQPIYSQQPIYLAHPGPSEPAAQHYAVNHNPAYYPLTVPPLATAATKAAEAETKPEAASASAPELTPHTENYLAEQTIWPTTVTNPQQQGPQPPAYSS